MTVVEILGLALALLVMLCGAVGSVVPAVPGTPLILVAAVGHRLYFGPSGASNAVLALLGLLAAVSFGLDYLAGVYGARKLGASRRGMIGAIVGGLVGIFFGLPGLILGPLFGAALFELAGGAKFKQAARVGAGTLLGLAVGAIGKFAVAVAMIFLFAFSVVYRSFS